MVSNFYSPENLALIAISNEFKLTSFDIQHGVQKNVIAYKRLNRFPMSLRPTEIVKWVMKFQPIWMVECYIENFVLLVSEESVWSPYNLVIAIFP